MRRVKEQDLVGKTIKGVDCEAINCLTLHFTDGTSLELEADVAVHTSFGSIPGILVHEPKLDKSETIADSRW